MPQQSSPPYTPNAIIQPRELQRWLDVNPQNGPLARTSTYIVLPAFAQGSSTWNGFSDIIFSYNVESPNSVGLLTIGTKTAPSYVISANPNYTLCISWRIGGNITRYVVWFATGTVLPFDVIPYTGQRLPKNWRFEIWNTSQGVVSNAAPITFYTTALGQIDYRYGSDSALVGVDAQCNNFACVDVTPYAINIIGAGTPEYDGSYIWNGVQWSLVGSSDSIYIQLSSGTSYSLQDDAYAHDPFVARMYNGTILNLTTLNYVSYWTINPGASNPGAVAPTSIMTPTFNLPLTFPANSVSVTN